MTDYRYDYVHTKTANIKGIEEPFVIFMADIGRTQGVHNTHVISMARKRQYVEKDYLILCASGLLDI